MTRVSRVCLCRDPTTNNKLRQNIQNECRQVLQFKNYFSMFLFATTKFNLQAASGETIFGSLPDPQIVTI